MFGFGTTVSVVIESVIVGILASLISYTVGHYMGYSSGYEAAQIENRQADFNQIKERQKNDAKVDKMPDSDVCRLLGGILQSDGSCV